MVTSAQKLLLLLFFTIIYSFSQAQTIKGKVIDAATGEPLVGAVVKLENTKYRTLTKLDGSFVFGKLPVSTYSIQVQSEGFASGIQQRIAIEGNATKTVVIHLKPSVSELSSVTVSAKIGRAHV